MVSQDTTWWLSQTLLVERRPGRHNRDPARQAHAGCGRYDVGRDGDVQWFRVAVQHRGKHVGVASREPGVAGVR